jgi:hypothetical protein
MSAFHQAVAVETTRGYRLTRVGLVIDRDLSLEEWIACGEKLAAFASSTAFAIGDWLVYGNGRGEYGETYTEAARITGRSYESLGQYDRVSRAFPIASRDPRVSWTIYRRVAVLPDSQRASAIRIAAEQKLTARDVLAHVQSKGEATLASTRRTRALDGWRPTEAQGMKTHVTCPGCGHHFEIRRKA